MDNHGSEPVKYPEGGQQRNYDSLMTGVMAMLLINIVQRLIGLGRNIGFCHFLSDDELGLWSLANSFLLMAPPFIVMGLPGSLGKFVEHYRQRGCLRTYFRRTAWASGLGLLMLMFGLMLMPDLASWTLFGQQTTYDVIVGLTIALGVLTFHNFIYDFALALRQMKIASLMQGIHSISFSLLSIGGLCWFPTWKVLIPAFVLSCILASLPMLYVTMFHLRDEFDDHSQLSHRGMWPRVLPFALALWCTNILSCMFEISDRYMLLHWSAGDKVTGQSLVGQYYCGRILPNLMYSLAMMFSGMLLPYLSVDWEQRRLRKISQQMNHILLIGSLGFTLISVCCLEVSPWLFERALDGRYGPAQGILALSLIQTVWSSLALIAGTYLLCAEKGGQIAGLLAVAIVINVFCNWMMIPRYQLYGAVLATTLANLLLMLGTYGWLGRFGCRLEARVFVISLLPLTLVCGSMVTSGCLALLLVLAGRTQWLLSDQDRERVDAILIPVLKRCRIPLESLWPAKSLASRTA
jgi:O-antigen/teichoic acid export membrane protein